MKKVAINGLGRIGRLVLRHYLSNPSDVIPELKGRMDAIAVRAPIPNGALIDIVAYLKKDVSVETVNSALRNAAGGRLRVL